MQKDPLIVSEGANAFNDDVGLRVGVEMNHLSLMGTDRIKS